MTTVALEPDTKRAKLENKNLKPDFEDEKSPESSDEFSDSNDSCFEDALDADGDVVIELNNYWPHEMMKCDDFERNENWLFFCKSNISSKCDIVEWSKKYWKGYRGAQNQMIRAKGEDTLPWLFFKEEENIFVYLNISAIEKNPSLLTREYIHLFTEIYFLDKLMVPPELKHEEFKYSGTSEYPKAKISPNFKLKLRDYQLRTISWMQSIEDINENEHNMIELNGEFRTKFKLGDTSLTIGGSGFKERIRGGILADDTGSGKTITTLALIHSRKFTAEHEDERRKRFPDWDQYHQSRASCIVCPSNIYQQWISEAKKCDPKFKIVGISKMADYKSYSLKKYTEADIVVVSYQFLRNQNYIDIKKIETSVPHISKIHFHRLILDESHELQGYDTGFIRNCLSEIRADYRWGLTGTPPKVKFGCETSIRHFSMQLGCLKLNETLISLYRKCPNIRSEYMRRFMKRNVPDLKLPELEHEIVYVEMSPKEELLFQSRSFNSTTNQQIMMCSHYQLTEDGNIPSKEFVSIVGAKQVLYKMKNKNVEKLAADLIKANAKIATKLKEDPEFDVKLLEMEVKKIEGKLKNAQSALNYFNAVFKASENPEENDCRICYEKIQSGNLTILPCCHMYCYDCLKEAVKKTKECLLCRSPLRNNEIIRVITQEVTAMETPDEEFSKYSSKLMSIYNYINEVTEKDPKAKMILFLQYKDLAKFVDESFTDLKINCVRVSGSILTRQKAIDAFKNSKDVKVIILNSEDSVSGMNLTEATHILFMHPFWTSLGDKKAVAYEKQGISRAHRFGLKHPLKIVRFAVKGTVEEKITVKRIAGNPIFTDYRTGNYLDD